MESHTFYASRNLTVDGKTIHGGTPILEVKCHPDIPIDRALNAARSGMLTQDQPDKKPKPEPKKKGNE